MREHLRSLASAELLRVHRAGPRGCTSSSSSTGCKERGITEPVEVTRPVLERYQRHLFHYRKKNGEPLSFRSQHARLVPLRVWFRWMTRQNHILHNPASEIDLPRLGRSLPKNILSAQEVEQIMTAVRRGGTHRAARPRAPGGAVLDRNAPPGNRAAEALRSSARPRADPDPPGQGQEGPLCAHRRAGRAWLAEVHRARRGPSLPSSRTTARCSSRRRANRSAAII